MFLIIYTTTEYIPGDERSRTHPGHGYPEHSIDRTNIKRFETEESFSKWVIENDSAKYGKLANYEAFKCSPVTISRNVEIKYVY